MLSLSPQFVQWIGGTESLGEGFSRIADRFVACLPLSVAKARRDEFCDALLTKFDDIMRDSNLDARSQAELIARAGLQAARNDHSLEQFYLRLCGAIYFEGKGPVGRAYNVFRISVCHELPFWEGKGWGAFCQRFRIIWEEFDQRRERKALEKVAREKAEELRRTQFPRTADQFAIQLTSLSRLPSPGTDYTVN
jgi:hypothetical protein